MGKAGILGFILSGIVLAVAIGNPEPVAAEYCRPAMPDHPQDASGSTFQATVTRIRTEGHSPALTYITMTVGAVYADKDGDRLRAGASIELFSNPCDGFGFVRLEVGDRVLMSTAYLGAGDGPSTWNTAVWRIKGERLRLLLPRGQGYEKLWFTSDRRILHADTLREALDLVAPNAIGIPDSATGPRQSPPIPIWPLAAAGIGALVAVATRRHPVSG